MNQMILECTSRAELVLFVQWLPVFGECVDFKAGLGEMCLVYL